MKAQLKDIVPGRILYYVSCVDGLDNGRLSCKVIVTSKPYIKNVGIRFDSIDDYRISDFDWVHENAGHYLGDLGMSEARNRYNLHSLFTSRESALDYVEQCNSGKFTDPRDQEYHDKTSTAEHIEHIEHIERKALQDLADWEFDSSIGTGDYYD